MASPSRPRAIAAALALGALSAAAVAHAAPTPQEVATLCAEAEGPAHCGRLVEAVQLKRLPGLAVRNGPTLAVSLYPSGTETFADTEAINGGRTYSLWDVVNEIDAVVLYTTDGDTIGFLLLQRATGRRTELPAEPKVSPDRQRFAVADFCATRCSNELTVWRVARDGVRKESAWTSGAAWEDAAVTWTGADTLVVLYTPAGAAKPASLQRRLTDTGWQRY
ncbi:MAG: hypothetical protein ABI886_16365 [Betaproteobacteria bacterium]